MRPSSDTEQQPRHNAGCDGTPETGPCAACEWYMERVAEHHAFLRFTAMIGRYPRDFWGRLGWG